MLSFLFRKMWNNKWMMLSLLIGNILLIGIVSSAPMYVRATLQRVLIRDLQQAQVTNRRFPATAEFSFSFNNVDGDLVQEVYLETKNYIVPYVIETLEVPMLSVVQNLLITGWHVQPVETREINVRPRSIRLSAYDNFEDHITLTHGRLPSQNMVDGNIIEVLVNQHTIVRQNLLYGELLEVLDIQYQERDIYIQIVGIFEARLGENLYWAQNPNTFSNVLLVAPELIHNHFVYPYNPLHRMTSTWFLMLDYNQMQAVRVPYYLEVDEYLKDRFGQRGGIWNYRENFIDTIEAYIQRSGRLSITLWVLQAPLYVLLAFYIFMVSKQIVLLEQNDIAILKSRGASRGQLILVYLMQSVFVGLVSLILGIPLGMWICRVLGASNGFLELVQRTALEVQVTPEALLYSLLAALLSMITMLFPIIQFTRITIVDHKRGAAKAKKPLWQRFFLDFLCFAIASYGLYNFHNQRELMALAMVEVQAVDPLLFISASLFIIGLGLICLRLFPLVLKLIFALGRNHWTPAVYASMLKVMRSSGEEQFIMIFLIFTMAVGIFSAQSARTINLNNDHMILYRAGADLTFRERWRDNSPGAGGGPGGGPVAMPHRMVYFEPDFGRFTNFEEVDSLARVKRRSVNVMRQGSTVNDVQLMAIDTLEFGQTAWYREDLLPVHINHYLNSMAQRADAVLLSDNFRTRFGYSIGDGIIYRDSAGNSARGIIHGFVEHWPGFTPVEWVTERTGERVQNEAFLVVSNLGYLQTMWGVMPYEVWMRTNTPTNRFFYEFADERNLELVFFHDANAAVIASRSDPILQGTNGVLTLGFIVTLLICFTGFLIYWILSIKARVLQFGIFRAMGLSMRDVIGLLINEQLFITLTAVLIGAGVGEIASRLFVPLIQISYSAADQIIPLRIVTDPRDYLNLYGIIGMMIALCLIILGVIISRIKIAQALKLGED